MKTFPELLKDSIDRSYVCDWHIGANRHLLTSGHNKHAYV